MVFDFRTDAPVLNLGPRAHVRPVSNREYLLWPALAYRVVSPAAADEDLNFLQKAVLGLCAAGCRSPEELSARLHIHEELTVLILEELRRRRLIDREGVTERAVTKLRVTDRGRSDAIVAGWVFQDPWTGELWPRFVTSLDYCQTETDNDGFVSVALGSTGNPRRYRAFMQLPPREAGISQPTAIQVLRAAEAHRRSLRRAKESQHSPDDSSPIDTKRLEKIGLIEPQPRPVFLLTYLYLADTGNLADDWYVCEPFGFDPSANFRTDLELRTRESQGLLGTLQRLLGRSLHGDIEHYRVWKDRLREDAELRVDLSLTIAARELLSYPHLVEMEMGLGEAAADASTFALRTVASACRAALEALFQHLASHYSLRGISNGLYTGNVPNRNRQFIQDCYRVAARTIGLAGELPLQLLKVKPEHIKAVCEYNDSWRLRPSIVATLLLAARQADHPLRTAVQRVPDIFNRLEAVADISGEAIHSRDITFTLEDVRASVRTVYEVTSILMNLSYEEVSA